MEIRILVLLILLSGFFTMPDLSKVTCIRKDQGE